MNMAWMIKYAVQAGWARIVLLERLLPLTGLRATESGIDHRIIGVVIVVSTLVSVVSGNVVAISGFMGAGVACIVFATGQPTILARTKAGHECREGCHRLWLLLAEVAGEPFIAMLCLKAARASASGQSTIWFFLVKNLVQNFLADSPGG